MDTQLAVIGGGPGGYAAAFRAADLGMGVTLINQEESLGGVCLLRGCIPSKALLHVAKMLVEADRLADWGVSFGRPEIKLDALRARKQQVIAALAGGLRQLAARRKVRVVRARASFLDSRTLKLESAEEASAAADDRVVFEHCIVATGSRPATLPGPALPAPRVMNSAAALDLPEIPDSLLVVGGGYIGLELGTVYAALGTRVSVAEMTGGLLPGVDADLVRPLHKKLNGVFEEIRLETKVAALADKGNSIEVTFDGNARRSVEQFDRVLISVGRRANSDALGLENTKVELDGQGFVTVDGQQRTADGNILAIGDVAGGAMLAHKAARQGKVAAEVLAGQPTTFQPAALPAVVFTDPEIAWAGLTETECKAREIRIECARFPWAASGRAQADGSAEGLTKWLVDARSARAVGCGIVGRGAGELIGEAALAIAAGISMPRIAEAIHPHPTLSETLGAAAEVYLGAATDLYRPKR